MDTVEVVRPVQSRCRYAARALAEAATLGDSSFLTTLLAMVGHDLRQPLQLITSSHDVLATMLRRRDQREELAQATDATAQLARMLGQLVEALHLQQRPREELRVPVPLRPILDDLVVEFNEVARRKEVAFRVTNARGTAWSHPVLLTSMLRNLVRNAIDYTPPGGCVFVASRRCGPALRIAVRDTGAGIRADALATIFDAFRRADNSRSDGLGLGLGLFIVKRAADLIGHRIEVQSVEGHGSKFTVVAATVQPSYWAPTIVRPLPNASSSNLLIDETQKSQSNHGQSNLR